MTWGGGHIIYEGRERMGWGHFFEDVMKRHLSTLLLLWMTQTRCEMSGNLYFWPMEVVNKPAPIGKRKVKSKPSPWITAELRQKMRKREFLKNQAVKQNSHQA